MGSRARRGLCRCVRCRGRIEVRGVRFERVGHCCSIGGRGIEQGFWKVPRIIGGIQDVGGGRVAVDGVRINPG